MVYPYDLRGIQGSGYSGPPGFKKMAKKQKEKTSIRKAVIGLKNPIVGIIAALLAYYLAVDSEVAAIASGYIVERIWSYAQWRINRDGKLLP